MVRAVFTGLMVSVLGTGWYLADRGVWGVSSDLQTVRTGSAGVPYYGIRSVK